MNSLYETINNDSTNIVNKIIKSFHEDEFTNTEELNKSTTSYINILNALYEVVSDSSARSTVVSSFSNILDIYTDKFKKFGDYPTNFPKIELTENKFIYKNGDNLSLKEKLILFLTLEEKIDFDILLDKEIEKIQVSEFSKYTETLIENVKKTKSYLIIVSDTLNDGIFGNDDFINLLKKKLLQGIKVIFISGKYIEGYAGKESPMYRFYEECINSSELAKNIAFYVQEKRPPIFHYIIRDDEDIWIEAMHMFKAKNRFVVGLNSRILARTMALRTERCILTGVNEHKLKLCSKEQNILVVKENPPASYIKKYHTDISLKDLDIAENEPKEWLKRSLRNELTRLKKYAKHISKKREKKQMKPFVIPI